MIRSKDLLFPRQVHAWILHLVFPWVRNNFWLCVLCPVRAVGGFGLIGCLHTKNTQEIPLVTFETSYSAVNPLSTIFEMIALVT